MALKRRFSLYQNSAFTVRPGVIRTSVIFLVVVVVAVIYYQLNMRNYAWYNSNSKNEPCVTPEKEMHELLSLAEDVHVVLTKLGINHFLVYGSLWGGLRYKRPLPWDNDFDFGVIHPEIVKYSEEEMVKSFAPYGINCYYSFRGGFYRVTRGTARGDIMVYRDFYNNGVMHRIGVEAYIFFINYRHFHAFPARLVQLPMPTMQFGRVNVSVPHEGVELQKYHYPNDWWKVGKPHGCD